MASPGHLGLFLGNMSELLGRMMPGTCCLGLFLAGAAGVASVNRAQQLPQI